MSTVYLAEHPFLRTKVAIKVIHQHLSAHREMIDRFFTEALATSKIRHPRVVEVIDCGRTPEGDNFIIMEYIDGRPLSHCVPKPGRFDAPRALALATQVLEGLEAAHGCGIIHRDLKPDNIFLLNRLDGADDIKIMDFGLAKLAQNQGGNSGALLGTPHYMSPEQCAGQGQVDPRADLYSMGCVLYWMLTGVPPFDGDDPAEVMGRHMHEQPPSVRARNPTVSLGLEQIILRCLAKRREERFLSAGELIWVLRDSALHSGPRRPSRAPTVAAPVALPGGYTPVPAGTHPSSISPPLVPPSIPSARTSGRFLPGEMVARTGTLPAMSVNPSPMPALPPLGGRIPSPPPQPAPRVSTSGAYAVVSSSGMYAAASFPGLSQQVATVQPAAPVIAMPAVPSSAISIAARSATPTPTPTRISYAMPKPVPQEQRPAWVMPLLVSGTAVASLFLGILLVRLYPSVLGLNTGGDPGAALAGAGRKAAQPAFSVMLLSDPDRADVYRDERLLGRTPLFLQLNEGELPVSLTFRKEGHLDTARRIDREESEVMAQLYPRRTKSGEMPNKGVDTPAKEAPAKVAEPPPAKLAEPPAKVPEPPPAKLAEPPAKVAEPPPAKVAEPPAKSPTQGKPADPSLAQELAKVTTQLEQRQYDVARSNLERLVSRYPNEPELFEKLGACATEQSRYPAAEEYYQRALTLRPGYSDAYIGLADVAERRGNAPQAITWYKQYLQSAPRGQYAGLAEARIRKLGTR